MRIDIKVNSPGAVREDLGIAISDSQVWRICTSMGLKPWQVRSWMTSQPGQTLQMDIPPNQQPQDLRA